MKNSEYKKIINRMTAHSCKLHTTMTLAVIQIFKKEKQNNDTIFLIQNIMMQIRAL